MLTDQSRGSQPVTQPYRPLAAHLQLSSLQTNMQSLSPVQAVQSIPFVGMCVAVGSTSDALGRMVSAKQARKLLKVRKSLHACLHVNPKHADAKSLILACSEAAAALEACNLITDDVMSLDLEARLETLTSLNLQYGIGNLLFRALQWAVVARCNGAPENSRKARALDDLCLGALKHLKLFLYTATTSAMSETLCMQLFPSPSGNAGS